MMGEKHNTFFQRYNNMFVDRVFSFTGLIEKIVTLFCDKRRERIMRRTRHDTTSRRAYDLSETEAQILRITRRGRWTHKTKKYPKSLVNSFSND